MELYILIFIALAIIWNTFCTMQLIYECYDDLHEQNIKQNLKLNTIMATLAQLSAKVDELQVALDSEQEQIREAIAALEAIVITLTEEVAAGGTEAERQAIADKIDSVIADLKSTVTDESTTTSTTETTTEVVEVPGE